jgi:hypothetical protein
LVRIGIKASLILRRDIEPRADGLVDSGQPLSVFVKLQAESEVGEHNLIPVKKDVRRLHVAMSEVALMNHL